MQLLRLKIREFRNLKNVELYFPTQFDPLTGGTASDQTPQKIRSHAIIGQNGVGKSNLIEALIIIFRDVDLDRDVQFDFELEYTIHDHVVQIMGDRRRQKRPLVLVDDLQRSQAYLLENRELLPSHIFAYYSGRNERIEALFQEHQRRFIRRQEITAEEVLPEELLRNFKASDADIRAIDAVRQREESRTLRQFGDDRLRRLFYCRSGHSQLVLLACLLSDDPVFKSILDDLHIEALESALFVLKQPHRLRDLGEEDILSGDPRFWYARGNVVSEFLDKLWRVAWAPIQDEVAKLMDFRGRRERQKQLYLFVASQEKLRQLGDEIGPPSAFFRYAEGAYIGDLIDEVRITVRKRDGLGGKVSFTQLSEGELQILTVLGLMRITGEDNSLFLLDEPDTHLNPIWKLRYFEQIESVLSSPASSLARGGAQVVITTHDPMMVGGLRREQVNILRRENGHLVVDKPIDDPQGMGVTGLLKSDLFGLSSTLDIETERRIFRRNELFAKDARTPEEELEMQRLSAELADLGFANSDFKDPFYAQFVRKMAKHTKFHKPALSVQEQVEQDRVADEIIAEILREADTK